MQSSSKQNKNIKLWDIPEVTSFVISLSVRGQLHWAWPKREIQSLILWQKALEFTFLGLESFLDVIENQNLKKLFGRMDTLIYISLACCAIWQFHHQKCYSFILWTRCQKCQTVKMSNSYLINDVNFWICHTKDVKINNIQIKHIWLEGHCWENFTSTTYIQ